jgi:hypothetical protein
MHEEVNEAADNARLDDSLNLVGGPVRKVGDGPAGVNKDLVVEGVDELRENGEGGRDLQEEENKSTRAKLRE